jgi:hypothetical protein
MFFIMWLGALKIEGVVFNSITFVSSPMTFVLPIGYSNVPLRNEEKGLSKGLEGFPLSEVRC